jgi:hypothetical protein
LFGLMLLQMTPPSGISRAAPSKSFAVIPFSRGPVEDVARVLPTTLLYIFQMNIFFIFIEMYSYIFVCKFLNY